MHMHSYTHTHTHTHTLIYTHTHMHAHAHSRHTHRTSTSTAHPLHMHHIFACDAPRLCGPWQVLAYYAASAARKNCVLVPLGPAPLMAYVTTRPVAAEEELLTCYGADYWLALSRPDGARALELTPPIHAAVAESAACLRERAQGVARDYAADAAALEAVFAQLSTDGGE